MGGLQHFHPIESYRALFDELTGHLAAFDEPCTPQILIQTNFGVRHSSCRRAASEDCPERRKANRGWLQVPENASVPEGVLSAGDIPCSWETPRRFSFERPPSGGAGAAGGGKVRYPLATKPPGP